MQVGRTLSIILFILSAGGSWRASAACDACGDFQAGIVAGTISVTALKEASGLAASARNPGVLWTHNDGSQGKIYAVSTNGSLLATFDVNNVDDLEDVAVGPGPTNGVSYLYLGDIGGSVGTNEVRSSVKIIRVPEPAVDLAWATNSRTPEFDGRQLFTLAYPDGSFDAEGLMVDPLTGDLFVVTKQSGAARIYRANLNAATNRATVAMEFVTSVPFHQASAGDISADGSQIILRREDFAQLWPRCDGESISAALAGTGQNVPLVGPPTEPNGEGLSFLRDGTGYVTISEGTNPAIYFFRSLCPAPPRFTLSISNLSVLTGSTVQFRSAAVGFPDPTYAWYFNGALLAGETNPVLSLTNVGAGKAGEYQVVAFNTNGAATNMATLTVRSKPDLRITEVLSSAAASPGLSTGDWWELTSFENQPVNLAGWRFNDSGGGLTDPFVIPGPLTIAPGESIIFVEGLTAAEFLNWWGVTNLPAGVQVISYSGSGLSLGAGGDGLRLWDNVTASANDTVVSVEFGPATDGISFNYDPIAQTFGAASQLGVNGVIQAAAATDIGSPGRIVAKATTPVLSVRLVEDRFRIQFDAVAGHHYTLEARADFTVGAWTPTGDSLQAVSSGPAFFETDATADTRFFRVLVD